MVRQGKRGEGEAHLSVALWLNPGAPGAHYYLATALVRQVKPAEALRYAQKARDLALAAGQKWPFRQNRRVINAAPLSFMNACLCFHLWRRMRSMTWN